MQTIENRSKINVRDGTPRAVRLSLCTNHEYLTLSGECSCVVKNLQYKYAVVGTMYGWLHNTSGDVRTWRSASAAKSAAERYAQVHSSK